MFQSESGGRRMVGQASTQSFKVITQFGDVSVIKQGYQTHHHHHHHHPYHHNHQQQQQQQDHQHQASSKGANGMSQQGVDQHQSSATSSPVSSSSSSSSALTSKPIIMTFHDIGLNSELQFSNFCECDQIKLMLKTFTMIHVNFIGQEFVGPTTGNQLSNAQGCADLPDDFRYPTVDQMAESIVDVCTQLRVRSFIGLAVGAGAYIVSSLALMRPDLVDGLFLINPVISSCSITEWLYFKMSAIASSHHLSGAGGSRGSHRSGSATTNSGSGASSNCSSPQPGSSGFGSGLVTTGSVSIDSTSHHNHNQQHQHQHKKTSGLKRLLTAAAHINLSGGSGSSSPTGRGSLRHHTAEQQHGEETKDRAEMDRSNDDNDDDDERDSESTGSGSSRSESPRIGARPTSGIQGSGSRLRKLILSRNFRIQQMRHRQPPASSTGETVHRSQLVSKSSTSIDSSDTNAANDPSPNHHSHPTNHQSQQQQQQQQQATNSKRPPIEYLMYHHFGSAPFQRFRRSSDTPTGSGDLARSPADSPARRSRKMASVDSDSAASVSSSQPAINQRESSEKETQQVQSIHNESPISRASIGTESRSDSLGEAGGGRLRSRSSSLCMSANYLASFSNERQRYAHIQAAYRHYFGQLNSHNMWLLAQTFAKRRSLNLRKDCGAAAHAAAAAAALGTSICNAFVGAPEMRANNQQLVSASVDDLGVSQSTGSRRCDSAGPSREGMADVATSVVSQAKQSGAVGCSGQPQPQAQVAGVKVKRTFTCQTLIMCSSVPLHCDRAYKLMSLLNPLQATCIKTEHLLVLEERPDKVCQALRLFLQGIGYPMSTYERRLRLNSRHGSNSSADSGSSRSDKT